MLININKCILLNKKLYKIIGVYDILPNRRLCFSPPTALPQDLYLSAIVHEVLVTFRLLILSIGTYWSCFLLP
jgi:hypothetical protein